MSDYERIAKIIRYLEEHQADQPDLATLAAVVGLSSSHFHRLFSRWAGITPKDFLQSITLKHARELLREGKSVLDTSIETGLSGPGRLHDLCINLEAATPGEIKTGGAGWEMRVGMAESPFGVCILAENSRGICHLSFSKDFQRLEKDWPYAQLVRDDVRAKQLAGRIFSNAFQSLKPLKAYVRGTEFQVRVWRALLEIPNGQLVSYGQLASALEKPDASRAVGTAVGKNPLGFLIPCHRVIRETGALGGYAWGPERKRAIQVWELSQTY